MEREDIQSIPIEEEMKRSYLDYAMSVIVSRALPDARDGLKTVHRRILFVMKERGYEYNKPHKKSAFIVGEVMGKYHPHGNVPIYEAMARMAQDFNMGMNLVDGQGNFGSIDGDPPAADRYTEARLTALSGMILEDLDKETVAFQANYDGSLTEPVVLPSRFPNLLLNGCSGIAVGMATNIPTHNLIELLDACTYLIDHPEATVKDLMAFVRGPDFPTGGQIIGLKGIQDSYETGRGSIILRGKAEVESKKNDAIIITEIPYQVNKAKMVEKIGELVRDKIIEGISEIRDESNREGIRVVCELKRDANAQVVLNALYAHTQLQTSFPSNMLALVKGVPQTLSLAHALSHFVEFRYEVIVKRTHYFLRKAREKAHLLVGFAIILACIDEVIALIKAARDRKDAYEQLVNRVWDASHIEAYLRVLHESHEEGFRLTERQANAILDMRLHKLTSMEQQSLKDELGEVINAITDLLDLLNTPERIRTTMKNEFLEIKEKFGIPRRTEIVPVDGEEIRIEDLIVPEDMVITISHEGYIKRVPLNTYRAQQRGGKGRSGMVTKSEDYIQDILVAHTHDKMLFFSSYGQVYQIPVYKLPAGTPQSKGRAMVNILPVEKDEQITSILNIGREPSEASTLIFVTSLGHVRRNKLSDFDRIATNGKKAMSLDEGEKLIFVGLCSEQDDLLINTKQGLFIRFSTPDVRVFSGRDSNGVRGVKLAPNDVVISATLLSGFNVQPDERALYLKGDESLSKERAELLQSKEQFILTVTEGGYGKRTSSYEYRTTGRGGMGANAIMISEKNGPVVAAFSVQNDDEIILITDQGRLLRCGVDQIRIAGRRTQGVILLRVEEGEKVVGVSRVQEND